MDRATLIPPPPPAVKDGEHMSRGRRRELGGVDRLPSGRWRVRVLDPSTRQRVSIGTFTTKAEAELAFARVTSDQRNAARGWRQGGTHHTRRVTSTWLARAPTWPRRACDPRVRGLSDGYLRLHILPTLGAVPLCRLTTATVRGWQRGCSRMGFARQRSQSVTGCSVPSSTPRWTTGTS